MLRCPARCCVLRAACCVPRVAGCRTLPAARWVRNSGSRRQNPHRPAGSRLQAWVTPDTVGGVTPLAHPRRRGRRLVAQASAPSRRVAGRQTPSVPATRTRLPHMSLRTAPHPDLRHHDPLATGAGHPLTHGCPRTVHRPSNTLPLPIGAARGRSERECDRRRCAFGPSDPGSARLVPTTVCARTRRAGGACGRPGNVRDRARNLRSVGARIPGSPRGVAAQSIPAARSRRPTLLIARGADSRRSAALEAVARNPRRKVARLAR